MIGRDSAYLHRFIHVGTPRVLAEHDREAFVEHVGHSPDSLRHFRIASRTGGRARCCTVCGYAGWSVYTRRIATPINRSDRLRGLDSRQPT